MDGFDRRAGAGTENTPAEPEQPQPGIVDLVAVDPVAAGPATPPAGLETRPSLVRTSSRRAPLAAWGRSRPSRNPLAVVVCLAAVALVAATLWISALASPRAGLPSSSPAPVSPSAIDTSVALASPVETAIESGSDAAESPLPAATPTAAPTPTPEPTEAPARTPTPASATSAGYTWRAGNPDVLILGDIVRLPTGYLATCQIGDGEPMVCMSTDLLNWSAPDAGRFVNLSGVPFLPYATDPAAENSVPIKVAGGYVVESRVPANDSGRYTDWYSADGISWQTPIPPDQVVKQDCVRLPSANSCEQVTWYAANPKTGVRLAWEERWSPDGYGALFASSDGGSSWSVVKADYLLGTSQPPVVLADGTWILPCYWAPRPPAGSVYGDLPVNLATSRDGIHWSEVGSDFPEDGSLDSVEAAGSQLFGSFAVDNGSDYSYYLYVSTNAGKTWKAVEDREGDPVQGEFVSVVGNAIVVADGDNLAWVGTK